MKKEDHSSKEHIVFLGKAGFPIGLAEVQRMTLMARAMCYEGMNVTVICRKGTWEKNQNIKFGKKGSYEGIDYIYTSKSVFRPKGFINRNVQKLIGIYGEFRYLRRLRKDDKINAAIISNRSIIHILRYSILSVILNFPIVLNYVEMASSMQDRTGFFTKMNDYILDKWLIKLFDGALPISDRLMDYYRGISPSRPSMKLPILCDFEKFNLPRNDEMEPYFLYCGSMSYKQVIDFIIKAYKSISDDENTKLYMIVSGGSKKEMAQLQQEINKSFDTKPVKLFSDIPYSQLVDLYINAIALLIPLRPTVQDASRFPHKIGEYLASGNPVITTDVGEIKNYFIDGKTALIADSYTVDAYAEKMRFVLKHPEIARTIGRNGKVLGLNEFDYRVQGGRLSKFLRELYLKLRESK